MHGTRESERYERDQLAEFWELHNVRTVLAEYLQFAVQYVGLAKELGINFYAHAHGLDCSVLLRQENWIVRYREFNQASGVIVVSGKMKNALVGIGIRDQIITRIPCGVNAQPFFARPDRGLHVRFLAAGRVTGKKGPIFLLESFRRALQIAPGIEQHLVGMGELSEAVIQFIQAFSLESAVKLYGMQPPHVVQELLKECDVFVQHSVINSSTGDEEGFPVVILEAMAAGLPIVSTIHAGIPEAVVDGLTGYLVQERDVQAMAERMVDLASKYERRLAMGMKGSERVKAEFTWDRERRSLVETMGLIEGATVDPQRSAGAII
jgi:glycosyltransferase involved in cell wall biosynthesis